MTSSLSVLVACVLANAAPSAPVANERGPVFSRAEPHLLAGNAKLQAGDVDGALAAFHEAQAHTSDERAMVEYDVGQALVLQAQQTQQAAPAAEGGPPKLDVEDARAAFERSFGLASHPALKSEAALASGNAAALAGDVESAIKDFRRALVADPSNERARKNLRRALDAKRAQPPPPPQKDGDKKDDDKKDDDKKDGEQKPKDGDKQDDKKDDDKKDGDKEDGEQKPKDGDKKDEAKPEPKDGDKGDKKAEQQPTEGEKDPKKQKQQNARRLLDALRSREKPLTPMEMRGTNTQRPKDGKDW